MSSEKLRPVRAIWNFEFGIWNSDWSLGLNATPTLSV